MIHYSRYLSLLLILVFLSSCLNPQKLLEAGKTEKAAKVCLNRLSGRKIKQEHLLTLEEAQKRLLQADILMLNQLVKDKDPSQWPKVYDYLLGVVPRQEKIKRVAQKLNDQGYPLSIHYLNTDSLIAEARQNAATYHYALAQEDIPSAHSGDRLAARRAWQQLKNCQKYLTDFKDVSSLEKTTYELGLTHLRLSIDNGELSPDFLEHYLDNMLRSFEFPDQKDWTVLHYGQEYTGQIHYEVVGLFKQYDVSDDIEDEESCNSTKKVEDGFITKRKWCDKDSCYKEVKEIIYTNVSATSTTITQSKNAYVKMQVQLINPVDSSLVYQYDLRGSDSWSNEFTKVSGDSRAQAGSSCPDNSGMCSTYPSDDAMIRDCMSSLGRRLKHTIHEKLPEE